MKTITIVRVFVLSFLLGPSVLYAAPDSVLISGRILNLTPKLYREASSVRLSRNNVLRPSVELTRQAPLQADGSFRIKLPLMFEQEEIYLDYGGQVFVTMLASPGTLTVTWDADSMFKAKRLFYFAGVNAEANNQYVSYLEEENKIMGADKRLGAEFFRTFWQNQNTSSAQRQARQRADLRLTALAAVARKERVSPLLEKWVSALVEGEYRRILLEYAIANNTTITGDVKTYLERFLAAPLTLQQVQLAASIESFAYRRFMFGDGRSASPRTQTVSVGTMAQLLLDYLNPLTPEERVRLNGIVAAQSGTRDDLNFMNTIFRRNNEKMMMLAAYEKAVQTYKDLLEDSTTELLKAAYMAESYPLLDLDNQQLLFTHIQKTISSPHIRSSMEEIHTLEMSDTLSVRLIQARKDLTNEPKEVLRNIWLAESQINGIRWISQIRELYNDRFIYYIKWNIADVTSRSELDYLSALRASLPENVLFVYLHLPDLQGQGSSTLWRQHIIKKRLEGVHLFLTETQLDSVYDIISPVEVPSFMLTRPGGRFVTRMAPPPSREEQTFEYINRVIQR